MQPNVGKVAHNGAIFPIQPFVSTIGTTFTDIVYLTQWARDKMDAISQTTFSPAFSSMKIVVFWLNFHWNMFARVQLTIIQHWFRWWLGADQATSHHLNQWWLVHRRIYAWLNLNELTLWRDEASTSHSALWAVVTAHVLISTVVYLNLKLRHGWVRFFGTTSLTPGSCYMSVKQHWWIWGNRS